MERTSLERAIARLKKEVEQCEDYKKKIISYVEGIKNKCLNKEITFYEYELLINKKLEGKTIPEWFEFCNSHIKSCEEKINREIKKFKRNKALLIFFSLFFVSFLLFASFYLKPAFLGFAAKEQLQTYTQAVNLEFEETSEYEWKLENTGNIQSVKLSGIIEGEGNVKIYLDDLLILDSSTIETESYITGSVIEETSSEQSESLQSPSEINKEAPLNETSPFQEEPPSSENKSTQLPQEIPEQNATQEPGELNKTLPKEQEKTIRKFSDLCTQNCNLKEFNLSKPSYKIKIEITNSKLRLNEINYEILAPVKEIPVEIPENITAINVTAENLTESNAAITTTQYKAVIGKPVKWKKQIELKKQGIIKIRLPKQAENINVSKIIQESLSEINKEAPLNETSPFQEEPPSSEEEKAQAKFSITGLVSSETEKKQSSLLEKIASLFKSIFSRITGRAITTEDQEKAIEITIQDNATVYEIEYETPSPNATEEIVSEKKKIITISAPDELNYTDILAYTTLEKEVSTGKIRLYHLINGTKEKVEAVKYDLNNNSLIDYIEWNVPHLSNQTYELVIEDFVELLIKTSDNCFADNCSDKTRWLQEMLDEERKGNYKQGYIIDVKPAGWNWGNLERDPKRFAIVRIPKEAWNESWLEPEYDYDKPIYDLDMYCHQDCMPNCIKSNSEGACFNKICYESCLVSSGNYEIKTRRKYKLPLESFMTKEEIKKLKNVKYNEEVNWTIEKENLNLGVGSIADNIAVNNWDNKSNDLKLHGSSGTFSICSSGCNYSSLANWESGEQANLTGTGPSIANITEGFAEGVGTGLIVTGWTTTPVDYIEIITAEGTSARHNGNWTGSAYILNGSLFNPVLLLQEEYVRVIGLQVENFHATNGNGIIHDVTSDTAASDVRIGYNIIRNFRGEEGILIVDAVNFTIYNNIAYNGVSCFYHYKYIATFIYKWLFYSNTATNCSTGFKVYTQGNDLAKNNIAFNNSDDWSGTFSSSSSNNAYSDNGPPAGSNNLNISVTNTSGSNIFVNYNSFTDLHINSNSPVISVGVSLASDSLFAFSDDIDNQLRDANWDIGADEFVAAAADTIYPTFSNYWDDNASLINSGTGLFNVTVLNTNGTVLLEINNTNITATNITANVYNASYNFTSSGTYSYKWHSWGNGTNKNYNVSDTRSYSVNASTVPQITAVYNNSINLANGPNEAPSITSIIINFTAYSPSGAGNLNHSTANVSVRGDGVRENASCYNYESSGNYANYTCNITMWWWDGTGTWNITASIKDNQSNSATNTSTNFYVGLRTSFIMGPAILSWSGIAPGAINQTSNNDPLVLNNTGNDNIAVNEIGINATNLLGEQDTNYGLWAGNFSVATFTGSLKEECNSSATTMNASIFTNVTGALLSKGNYTANDGTAQEQLYFCLRKVGNELTTQSYSTSANGAWTIRILVVFFAIRGLKKRNKKIIEKTRNRILRIIKARKLRIPITIFSDKLGALESVIKYLKENLKLSYHEIAELLNRDGRTIWVAYHKAREKQLELIKAKKTAVFLQVSILKNRKLTVLESVVNYLKEKGFKYSEIAELVKRDERNIWGICKKAKRKIKEPGLELREVKKIRLDKFILSLANKIKIPITIFSDKLGALESVIKYLKENLKLSYHEIAELLNRDGRTIWVAYHKAREKQLELIKAKKTAVFLQVSILKNRKLTVLESVVNYLKEKGFKYSEIAELVKRDERNIWGIYERAKEKIQNA